ncbi:hypothetical protein [Bartonella tribocorum]|uniref:hypothetical protein n=1 Tax=Bartonella tribocorum TaxID=85701 RepID=UPI0015DEB894|nr:hypothetical protein [Bartonella tribocorum]
MNVCIFSNIILEKDKNSFYKDIFETKDIKNAKEEIFSDDTPIMVNPLSATIFTLMKKQTGTITHFASPWVAISPWHLRAFIESHFYLAYTVLSTHSSHWLYANERFWLIQDKQV